MKKLLIWSFGLLSLLALLLIGWIYRVLSDLPDVATLKRYRPPAATEVLDRDGKILTHFYDSKFRIWVPIASLPDIAIRAVVIAEDDTFFGHEGVNYKAVWEALQYDVQKRRFARGGSTITQQMIKNVFLSKEKTITRKIREFVLAQKAEQILTKRQILEIYLNEVEWGLNIYGIEAASRFYFDKPASELNIPEAALLAGMLPNPKYYNPFKRMDKAKHRQEQVLFNMQQAKLITKEEYESALKYTINLRQEGAGRLELPNVSEKGKRPCYQEALEQVLSNVMDEQGISKHGGIITTTIDKSLQNELKAWEEALPDKVEKPADRISVVTLDGTVRAIVCVIGKDQELRSKVEFLGINVRGYEVIEIPIDSLPLEQISAPAAAQNK